MYQRVSVRLSEHFGPGRLVGLQRWWLVARPGKRIDIVMLPESIRPTVVLMFCTPGTESAMDCTEWAIRDASEMNGLIEALGRATDRAEPYRGSECVEC